MAAPDRPKDDRVSNQAPCMCNLTNFKPSFIIVENLCNSFLFQCGVVFLKQHEASARSFLLKVIPYAWISVKLPPSVLPEIPSHCVRQVKTNLPTKLKAAQQMHKTPALSIDAGVKEKDNSGYKAFQSAYFHIDTSFDSHLFVNQIIDLHGLVMVRHPGTPRVA